MRIKGFVDLSMVDWDGHVVSVVWTPGCNFRCGFCFNKTLVLKPESLSDVPEEKVLSFLDANRRFLDGICITGGEPTLQPDLDVFCGKVKKLGLKVKLDSNGSNPAVLKSLISRGLIDYVALDVKAPLNPESYGRVTGVSSESLVERVKESISLLMNSGLDYEFRTTVVPGLHSEDDIRMICEDIRGAKRYVLQVYRPGDTIDPSFKMLKPPSREFMLKLAEIASKYVKEVRVRGLV
ncbi:MAG: ribonucleoside-triphosphate reductase-like protein [Candidatus Bathyarchaeota archaeon B24]|nr:MAG: ribonucleoside-triphosphate reductase-like protein [Candidatus Bathyarchaeota archaeon B24]